MNRTDILIAARAILSKEEAAKKLRAGVAESEKLARSLEAEATKEREVVREYLATVGSMGIDGEGLAVSRVATPPKVVLDAEVDEKLLTWKGAPLPEEYIVQKPSLNRALLSAHMKAGLAVGFARIVTGETLKIEHLAPGEAPEQEFA